MQGWALAGKLGVSRIICSFRSLINCQCSADWDMMQGWALAGSQFRAQAGKRGASMLRDRRTLLWQIAVPVALVTLSLLANRASFVLQQPSLVICRCA